MKIQYDGQNSAYLPSYTAQAAASGTTQARPPAPMPAGDPSNPVQQRSVIFQSSQNHLEEAAAHVQNQLKEAGVELNFSIDKDSGETVVKVIDPATQEVIHQMPSKEMLAISRDIEKRIQGLLINQKV